MAMQGTRNIFHFLLNSMAVTTDQVFGCYMALNYKTNVLNQIYIPLAGLITPLLALFSKALVEVVEEEEDE